MKKEIKGVWVKLAHPKKDICELTYECSRCGRTSSEKEPYCHCGAKMSEKEVKTLPIKSILSRFLEGLYWSCWFIVTSSWSVRLLVKGLSSSGWLSMLQGGLFLVNVIFYCFLCYTLGKKLKK